MVAISCIPPAVDVLDDGDDIVVPPASTALTQPSSRTRAAAVTEVEEPVDAGSEVVVAAQPPTAMVRSRAEVMTATRRVAMVRVGTGVS
jgi:hypothetical protein